MSRAVLDDDEPLSMATTDLSPDRPIREGSSSRGPAPEGGLPELFDAVRWRWRPTMLIALLFFLGATIYVERLPSQYDGVALLAISPRLTAPNAGADTVRVGAPKYVEYVIAAATVRRVAFRIDEDQQTLQDAVGAHLATDTGNVTITVRLPSPTRAARAANAFADSAIAYSQTDKQLAAELVAPALAFHVKATCALPPVAVSPVGAAGAGGSGVALTWLESGLVPPALDAFTT